MSRRLRRPSGRADAEINLTPMLDMVFILLIFFIITAVFITDHAIGLEPPPPQSRTDNRQPIILVETDDDRLIRVNGHPSHIERVEANLQRVKTETSTQAVIYRPTQRPPID